jgi:hypothetical protein
MAVVISLGIAVVVVAFVAAPFFLLAGRSSSPVPEQKDSPHSEALAELLGEKETLYAAIQELDFDFKSGKLSAEDHQVLRARHVERAATLLKQIDEMQGTAQKGDRAKGSRRERRDG